MRLRQILLHVPETNTALAWLTYGYQHEQNQQCDYDKILIPHICNAGLSPMMEGLLSRILRFHVAMGQLVINCDPVPAIECCV